MGNESKEEDGNRDIGGQLAFAEKGALKVAGNFQEALP